MRRRPSCRAARASVALLATAALGACGGEELPPVSAPQPGFAEPRVVEADGVPLLEYAAPRETLFVRDRRPPGGARLLFYRGQGASRDSTGAAYVTDREASRILVVGPDLRVLRTVGGPSEEGGALGLPLATAPTRAGGAFVIDVEHPAGLLYFDPGGGHVGSASPPVLNPNLASDPSGFVWAARSPYILGFEPTEAGDPLLYRFDPLAGEGVGIAEIEPLPVSDWNRLANAGAVAAGPDGTGFFAFLLRNEVRAYGPDGELRWRSRRLPGFPTPPPRVVRAGDEVRLRLRPVTQALAVGPDGLLYALTATDDFAASAPAAEGGLDGDPAAAAGPEPSGGAPGAEPGVAWRRVEVWDPTSGELLRASRIPASWTTLAADAEGRVYRADAGRILASAPEPERGPLPRIALETFDGDSVGFDEFRGRALLINFWASWCEPCKRELPQLEEYYATLDRERVEFLAISEDTDAAAARRFAASLDLSFPLFLGRGKMREHFRYLGLPYTLVADYRGRIVAEFMGFGSPESWRRLTSALEAEMARAAPAVAPGGHDGGHEAAGEEDLDAHEHAGAGPTGGRGAGASPP